MQVLDYWLNPCNHVQVDTRRLVYRKPLILDVEIIQNGFL